MSKAMRIYFCIASMLLLVSLSACSQTDREEAIHELLQHTVALAEAQDVGGLLDLTQDGFTADPGGHTSADARRILFVTFKRFGKFHIYYSKPAVRLSEDEGSAQVKLNFIMATNEQTFLELEQLYQEPAKWIQAIDQRADIYSLTMDLEFVSGDWMVSKVKITSFAWPRGRL